MTRPDRANRHDLVDLLANLGTEVRGSAFRCLWHEDGNASGSVFQGDGHWRFKCHGCGAKGDAWDLAAQRAGNDLATWLRATATEGDDRHPSHAQAPDRREPDRARRHWSSVDALAISKAAEAGAVLEALHTYDKPGEELPALVVLRLRTAEGKTFRQAHHDGTGWTDAGAPKPWPLYQLGTVMRAEALVIVEGEKAADALCAIGIPATTTPCGAGKAEHCDLTPLQGKRVCLWPDHDETGAKHMDDVATRLSALPVPPQVRRIDPARLPVPMPPKGDAVEFLAAVGGDAADKVAAVKAVLRAADPTGPTMELRSRLEAQIDGRHALVPFPWPAVTHATMALLPGTVTLLCGSPGAAKSFWLLQATLAIYRQGTRVALLELEESREYHLQRALAQLAGRGDLTDPRWVMANADTVRAALVEHGVALDAFGRCVWAQGNVTLDGVADWIEERAQAGVRMIAVDPITLADPGTDRAWTADRNFMARVKPVIERTGASLVLVTHPRKASGMAKAGPPSLDDMAGGTAYQRAAQTVLWLQSTKGESMRVHADGFGQPQVSANKILSVLKARNSAGMGQRIAFSFSGADLCFREHGVMVEDERP